MIKKYLCFAIILDDRVYVPIRYVVESLGAEVEWDSGTKTVIILTLQPGGVGV